MGGERREWLLVRDAGERATRVELGQSALRIGRDEGNQIVLQLVRAPLPTFSSALTAYVEAHYPDDATKNRLCATVPFPDHVDGYPASVAVSMANQAQWSQDKQLRQWVRNSRLDGFGKMVSEVDPTDTAKLALLARLRQSAMAAMVNLPNLMGRSA